MGEKVFVFRDPYFMEIIGKNIDQRHMEDLEKINKTLCEECPEEQNILNIGCMREEK